jgi:hypothetical protein
MLRIASALAVFLSFSPLLAGGVHVEVLFQNGDRVTGDLRRADTDSVEFHPHAAGLGDSVRLRWLTDGIAELRLQPTAGASTACLYLSASRPSKKGSEFNDRRLCFKSAVAIRADGADESLHLTAKRPEEAVKGPESSVANGDKRYFWVKSFEVEQAVTVAAHNSQSAGNSTPPLPVQGADHARGSSRSQPSSGRNGHFLSLWSLNINAPESVVQGTQSQQLFGGLFRTDLYAGDANHFTIVTAGSHQHNVSLHKPPQRTDLFDSSVQVSHSYPDKFGFYGASEWFLNTSLGMAAERSVGGGIILPAFTSKSENFFVKAWVDLRYFNERLYTPHKVNLIGSVVRGELDYSPTDQKWFITAGLIGKPMFNDTSAWQSNGSLTLTVPLSTHVCLTVTPADDTYIGNSPHGFRRNYLKSTAGIQILAGSNPAQKCK